MSTKEEVLQRHKKEQKDLVATITGLKKQSTKKSRKNVISKCNELQETLNLKQKDELRQFEDHKEDEVTPEKLLEQLEINNYDDHKNTEDKSIHVALTKPKRNRQKERIAKRQAEIAKMKEEASREAENTIDYRKIEEESMKELLSRNGLQMHEINPDGHCLFASIVDQLSTRLDLTTSVQELRNKAASHIFEHEEDFIPFMIDEETDTMRQLADYIEELKSTAMWGSDMEILALAREYDCPVTVFVAGSSMIKINEQATNPELKLAYYKHSYGLGEHYNSLRDLS